MLDIPQFYANRVYSPIYSKQVRSSFFSSVLISVRLWLGELEGLTVQPDLADEALVDAVNKAAGVRLRPVGRAEAGTLGGAIFVGWPDGRPGVVTRFLGTVEEAERTAGVLAHARQCGLPVPRHELVVRVGEDVFMVQERLLGSPPGRMSSAVIDAVVAFNDRFAGLLADRPDVPALALCLDRSGDPYPKHEVLANHSDRSRRILERIRRVGARSPREVAGTDLLHIDLTPPNLLFDEAGGISGIVDWNLGAYRGDRQVALVKTRFELEWSLQAATPDRGSVEAAARLDDVLGERVPADLLQAYWAHRVLYQLHWALQFSPPEVVEWHLAVAEDRLPPL
jgi:aminoglycoside phosphotransferase (APT) family kinase protein